MATISVIIPVYNTAEYLSRCMTSVLGQTHSDLEILLINDGSTDSSPVLCDEFARNDTRIRVIHQENCGLSAARNAGLDAATGRYIGFVDSDDWIELDMYSYLLNLLEQRQGDIAEAMLEVAYSESHRMSQLSEEIKTLYGDDVLIHYFKHNEFAMGLRLYKREVFDDVRFEVGRMNEDVVAGFLALSCAECLISSNLPKYYYFSNPVGLSESPLRKRDLDLLHAGERLDELTSDTPNNELRKLALTKKYRAPFTLLVKMALFGCSSELDEQHMKRQLQGEARKNFRFLIASSMPLNRKLLLTACCVSYFFVKALASLYRKLPRKKT